jgi:hypothetical protein
MDEYYALRSMGSDKGASMKRDVLVAAIPRRVRKAAANKMGREKVLPKSSPSSLGEMTWRLERLEGQLQKLSELVREHAEDVDRLVRIVAEDRDVIRRQLLRKHHEKVRVRKHLRDSDSKVGLDS